MTPDKYVSFCWSKACLMGIRRLSHRNEIGLASFLSQAIICIIHVTIVLLFYTLSPQRSADGTSQEQQTEHAATSSSGVTSESAEELEGTTHKHRM